MGLHSRTVFQTNTFRKCLLTSLFVAGGCVRSGLRVGLAVVSSLIGILFGWFFFHKFKFSESGDYIGTWMAAGSGCMHCKLYSFQRYQLNCGRIARLFCCRGEWCRRRSRGCGLEQIISLPLLQPVQELRRPNRCLARFLWKVSVLSRRPSEHC